MAMAKAQGIRPGDLVQCVDDANGSHFLVRDHCYVVEATQVDSAGGLRLVLRGMARAWEAGRFRLTADDEPTGLQGGGRPGAPEEARRPRTGLLREQFAGQALSGILAAHAAEGVRLPDPADAARRAVGYADALALELGVPGRPAGLTLRLLASLEAVLAAWRRDADDGDGVREGDAGVYEAARELIADCKGSSRG
jgi:hypothetical protein